MDLSRKRVLAHKGFFNNSCKKIKENSKAWVLKVLRYLTPLVAVVLISIICGVLLLPWPWQKQKLFFGGYSSGASVNFQEYVTFKNTLNIIVNSTGFPSKLSYYDFYLQFNPVRGSSFDDALVLRFAVHKNTRFWNYVNLALGSPSKWLDTDSVGTYEINVGKDVRIRGVPIDVPVDYSAGMVQCGITKPCPVDFSNINIEDMINVYVSPNLLALFIQWLLIFSFWTVVINSFLDLIHQRWK